MSIQPQSLALTYMCASMTPFSPVVKLIAAFAAIRVDYDLRKHELTFTGDQTSGLVETVVSRALGGIFGIESMASTYESAGHAVGYVTEPFLAPFIVQLNTYKYLNEFISVAAFVGTGTILQTAQKTAHFVFECLFIPVTDDDQKEELPKKLKAPAPQLRIEDRSSGDKQSTLPQEKKATTAKRELILCHRCHQVLEQHALARKPPLEQPQMRL